MHSIETVGINWNSNWQNLLTPSQFLLGHFTFLVILNLYFILNLRTENLHLFFYSFFHSFIHLGMHEKALNWACIPNISLVLNAKIKDCNCKNAMMNKMKKNYYFYYQTRLSEYNKKSYDHWFMQTALTFWDGVVE